MPYPYRPKENILAELEKLENMSAVERKRHLKGKGELAILWSLHQVAEKEKELGLLKLKEMRGALAKAELAQAAAEEKEADKKEAGKLLRKTIERWIEEQRNR